MNTLKKYAGKPNAVWMEFYCLSTDEKPTVKYNGIYIPNASTLYEMDTKKFFLYDAENHEWLEQ